jgi:hypothetical protein
LVLGSRQKHPQNLGADAVALHSRHHLQRTKIDRPIVRPLLNPANIARVDSNDSDFIELEKPSKVLFLTGLIPSEQTLDNPAHRFEVQATRKREVLSLSWSKANIHRVRIIQFTG